MTWGESKRLEILQGGQPHSPVSLLVSSCLSHIFLFLVLSIGACSCVASQFRGLTWLGTEHFILAGWRPAWATCSGLPQAKLLPGSPPHWETPFLLLAGSSSQLWGEKPPSCATPAENP